MHLSELELFCEIVRVKSFSKAAKLLHLSQPAVSAKMHAIEDYYGAQLFERSRSGVSLTEIGEVVFKYVKEILRLHDDLEKEIDGMLHTEDQKLVIGASSTLGNYALPCSLWAYQEKYPTVKVRMEIRNADTIISMLKDNTIQLALLEEESITGQNDKFTSIIVSHDELIVIAPPRKPWTDKDIITLGELKKIPLIVREQGSGSLRIFEKILQELGLSMDQLNIKTELSSVDAIKSTVEAGLGLSICTRMAVRREIRAGLIHPLSLDCRSAKINYLIIYQNEKNLNSAAKRFIRLLAKPGDTAFC